MKTLRKIFEDNTWRFLSVQPRAHARIVRTVHECIGNSTRSRRTLETGYASAGTNAFTRLDLIK